MSSPDFFNPLGKKFSIILTSQIFEATISIYAVWRVRQNPTGSRIKLYGVERR